MFMPSSVMNCMEFLNLRPVISAQSMTPAASSESAFAFPPPVSDSVAHLKAEKAHLKTLGHTLSKVAMAIPLRAGANVVHLLATGGLGRCGKHVLVSLRRAGPATTCHRRDSSPGLCNDAHLSCGLGS